MIRAIETRYKGHLFRSRLEARWAIFFDKLGAKWRYEYEAFDIGNGDWYIPDFHFPDLGIWVEIKPTEGWDQGGVFKAQSFGAIIIYGSPDDYTTYDHVDGRWGSSYCADSGRWGMTFDELGFGYVSCGWFEGYRTAICAGCYDFDVDCKAIRDAISAAMAARFDHGKHP